MGFAIDAFDVRGPINEKCHQLQSNKIKFIHYIQVVLCTCCVRTLLTCQGMIVL